MDTMDYYGLLEITWLVFDSNGYKGTKQIELRCRLATGWIWFDAAYTHSNSGTCPHTAGPSRATL